MNNFRTIATAATIALIVSAATAPANASLTPDTGLSTSTTQSGFGQVFIATEPGAANASGNNLEMANFVRRYNKKLYKKIRKIKKRYETEYGQIRSKIVITPRKTSR